MFKCYRKYQKFYIILIMSIFGFCIFADEYEDLRQFGHKNNSVACMSIAEDDVDFDEDEEYLPDVRPDWSTTLCLAGFTITGLKTSEGNRSKALRIGQVRRHSPRENRMDSYNHTVSDNGSSGVGFPYHFFCAKEINSKNNKTISL